MPEDKKKILIVDDEEDIVAVVSMRLEAKGFLVQKAFNIGEGLACIKKEKPDLMLLDLLLPDGCGSELCKKLKDDPDTRDIAIITFSASSQKGVLESTLQIGASDFIVKPFDSAELLEKIRRVLG